MLLLVNPRALERTQSAARSLPGLTLIAARNDDFYSYANISDFVLVGLYMLRSLFTLPVLQPTYL